MEGGSICNINMLVSELASRQGLYDETQAAYDRCINGLKNSTYSEKQKREYMEEYIKNMKSLSVEGKLGKYYWDKVPDLCGDTKEWIQKMEKFNSQVISLLDAEIQVLEYEIEDSDL